MTKTYKRISNVDESSSAPMAATNTNTTSTSASTNATTSTISEQLYDKLHAIFFISLSYVTIKYTDTISILLTSADIIRPLLYISIALITVNTILLSYLSIYIPKIKGIKVDEHNNNKNGVVGGGKTNSDLWQVYCPRVIPIMTLNGVLCGIFLMRCFWPVWGFLTPFILGVEFFGLLFVTHFIPWV